VNNFTTITQANGDPANADDMSPHLRAFAVLLEHANLRTEAGLTPTACPCPECERHRVAFNEGGGLMGGLTEEEYQAECDAFADDIAEDDRL
jgi:hypothetical protein